MSATWHSSYLLSVFWMITTKLCTTDVIDCEIMHSDIAVLKSCSAVWQRNVDWHIVPVLMYSIFLWNMSLIDSTIYGTVLWNNTHIFFGFHVSREQCKVVSLHFQLLRICILDFLSRAFIDYFVNLRTSDQLEMLSTEWPVVCLKGR